LNQVSGSTLSRALPFELDPAPVGFGSGCQLTHDQAGARPTKLKRARTR